jgi:hypothetical protein
MKIILAAAITAVALVSACGGNTTAANPTAAYLADVHANLKAAGLPPALSVEMQSGNFDKMALLVGHQICDMAAQGKSPDEMVAVFQPDPGREQYLKNEIAAAETYLCPQYNR